MAVHVPFSQRPSGQNHREPPIYIGFEQPRRRKRGRFNWWGFSSILFFFLSLGVLSPITLLMGLAGLRRKPRKTAVVGTLFSLIGVGLMAALVIGVVEHHEYEQHQRYMAEQGRVIAVQVEEGNQLLAFAASEFEQYRDDNDGRLPLDIDGNSLAIKHVDPWGELLRYEVEPDLAILRSAGPDGDFYTTDDLTYEIDGETEREVLLPIDG